MILKLIMELRLIMMIQKVKALMMISSPVMEYPESEYLLQLLGLQLEDEGNYIIVMISKIHSDLNIKKYIIIMGD